MDSPLPKITSLESLSNGALFVYLINLILRKTAKEAACKIEDAENPFALIKPIIETEFRIQTGIEYKLAQDGDEHELAKISLILLSNGVALDNEHVIKACEKLSTDQYEIMTDFYTIAERNKSKFPPVSAHVYELFLKSSQRQFSLSSQKNENVENMPKK